jgi:hypothetical protein
MLITTRNFAVATSLAAQHLRADTLSDEDGGRMRLKIVGLNRESSSDLEVALVIGKSLGGLPLTLNQIGGLISQWKSHLGDFLPMYRAGCNSSSGSLQALAATTRNKGVVQVLLQAGADANALLVGEYGSALVASASHENNCGVLQLLLEYQVDANAQFQVGIYGNALAAAAKIEVGKDMMQLLLESGADVDVQLSVGVLDSALAAGAYGDNMEIVQLLLISRANVNNPLQYWKFGSELSAAAYCENIEVLKLLLASGAGVNAPLQAGCCAMR